MYKVSVSGQEVGYVENKEAFEEEMKVSLIQNETKNVDTIDINSNPEYELKLVDRTLKTNNDEIIETVQEDVTITYKYYDIALNNETLDSVNTIEEAEDLVNKINEENENQ